MSELAELPEWRGKYADTDPFTKLHQGEPWFFLRAQDVTAPGGVEAYANTLNAQAATLLHVVEVLYAGNVLDPVAEGLQSQAARLHLQALDCFAAAEAMRQWQNRNPDKVKIPD